MVFAPPSVLVIRANGAFPEGLELMKRLSSSPSPSSSLDDSSKKGEVVIAVGVLLCLPFTQAPCFPSPSGAVDFFSATSTGDLEVDIVVIMLSSLC